MKRFVVIIASLIILFVFIALNYLLWDRESLVTQGESNQASIDALSRINMSLNHEKENLEQQAEDLLGRIGELDKKVTELETMIAQQQLTLDEKTEIILSLKKQVDHSPVQAITMEWVSALAAKEYADAFLTSGANCKYWESVWTRRLFSNYFDQNIEQIQFVLQGEEQKPVIEVVPTDAADWEMKISTHVQVLLKEGARQDFLQQGDNILYLTCSYSQALEQWMITSINSEEAAEQEEPPKDSAAQTGKEEEAEPAKGPASVDKE